MRRYLSPFFAVLFVLLLAGFASATNGDNMISIGPISRSMGGVGIAAPQDAIGAVFANPAAMCFGPYCPGAEVNFGGTLFMPKVDAKISVGGSTISADSDKKVYGIPAIGLSVPITNTFPLWRFGLAAYGVSGLGVDYRDSAIDNPGFYDFGPMGKFPLVAGEYTQLQIMKFSPSIAFSPNEKFSVGLGVHIDYAALDLRAGSSFNYGIGAQLGALYRVNDQVTIGAIYITPQEVNYKDVIKLDPSQPAGNLKLAQPQQFGLGISFEAIKNALLLEVDGRWINWSSAKGYDDFDWKDQWGLAIGAQFKPSKQIALRVGYNVANNPVREHNNFVGATPAGPNMISVQGNMMPVYYYETFRIIGFPAIVKQHVTFGIGYEVSNRFAVNAGYMHAFKTNLSENGSNIAGQPVTIESGLSEDSIEFGVTWRF